ncbi:MAG: TonB family protein [Betaproteobacteria bacterium]
MSDVTDVLRDRMQEPAGLQRMVTVSLAAHAALLAIAVLAPAAWWSRGASEPQTVMTITLGGGTPGPSSGGETPLAARPVQQAVQTPSVRPEPIRPPAAKAPEMTLPKETARPTRARPAPDVKQAPKEARGRTPTKGKEVSEGQGVAETGARGQGFGLSSGGGAGVGATLDVANFCCPDYLMTMVERIRANWNPQAEVAGVAGIKFTIQRDGRLTDVELEKSSGYTALDLMAQRAVVMTRQLPPLPPAYSNPTLGVHLNFQYQR